MKRNFYYLFLFIFLIFLSISQKIFSQIYSEIWSGIQLNYPTKSKVASAIGRIRIGGLFSLNGPDIKFHIRSATAYGKSYFGSTKLIVPANDVATDPHYFKIDEAYFLFHKKIFTFSIGLIDPYDTTDGYSGIFVDYLIGDENTGFLSPHFLRILANNGLDNLVNPSIPASFFIFEIIPQLISFKFGLTYGLPEKHLFLRNTLPIEMSIKTPSFHLSLNAGFCDADSSGTHSISPSYGIILEKDLFRQFILFSKFSFVEHDIKTFRTPEGYFSPFSVAQEFSKIKKHFNVGFVKKGENINFGTGYSYLLQFENNTPEKVIEAFINCKIQNLFEISPDFQYIFNPNSSESEKYMWIAGIRVFYRFNIKPY